MTVREPLAAGTRLGRYEIVGFIDAGGMGEVYRARDLELGRPVAIKILTAAAGERPDRLRRFEQEARVVAALNHPTILAIFDVGEHEGTPYIVTELLEGMNLRLRLLGAPLPLRKAVEFGIQIADGVAAAHDQGIVHRDLKPENIFITREERLKILDFGLAKLTADVGATNTQTTAGTVLGTLGYLSPEQASGQPADHRADIFSMGAVLFELVTHHRAFSGGTPAETLAAVLEHDPASSVVSGTGATARVMGLIRRCLEKAPERRFQSARDLSMVLANELVDASSGGGEVIPHRASKVLATAAIGVALLGFVAGAWLWGARSKSTVTGDDGLRSRAAVRRLTLSLPADLPLTYGSPAALAPDGSQLAVVLATNDGQRLYLRRLDRDELVELPNTDGAEFPFFSPDGNWLGFWARNRIWKISTRGGTPTAVADSPDSPFRGADWAGGAILFAPRALGPLSQVSSDGGAVRPATTLDAARGEYSHRWPQVLPDGRGWLYTALSGPVPGGTPSVMLHASSGESRELLPNALFARFVGDGLLVFVREGQPFVTRFDLDRLALEGASVPIDDPIVTRGASGATFLSTSQDGSAVFVKGGREDDRSMVWVDKTGTAVALGAPPANYTAPRLSPDGRRVAMIASGVLGNGDVWTFDLKSQVRTRLTTDGTAGGVLAWSSDGSRLLLSAARGGLTNLFVYKADGVSSAERLVASDRTQFAGSWGRDNLIPFMQNHPQTGPDIWALRLDDKSTRPVVAMPATQWGARVSPDGRWLAYISNESGRFEAFVSRFPQASPRWQISAGGGQEVVWSADGREVFFRQGSGMLGVSIDATATPPNGRARVLFDGSYLYEPNNPGIPNFDVARDGRFLMISSEQGPPRQVQVVLNWRTSLRERLAGSR